MDNSIQSSSLKDLFNLHGKRALVTGSSQGIGRAIAIALAEYGADVLVHCSSNLSKAESVMAEIEALGRQTGVVAADLERSDAAGKIVAAVNNVLGGVDILVLNASVQVRRSWREITPEEYRRQVDVNFGSCLWLCQRFAPEMLERKWGRILTIGSVQQVRPHPEMLVYSATKSALDNLVRSLAPQFAPFGVTINNLAPGVIDTPRNEQALADEQYKRKIIAKVPAGFVGEPVDCAGTALVICSDAGRYMTGQNIFVDGGMSLP